MHGSPARRTDRGRRLVEDEQFALAEHRARERDDLPLADGHVPAPARDLRVEPEPERGRALVRGRTRVWCEGEEAGGAEGRVQGRVGVRAERVEVLAERAGEELGLSWA